MGGSTTQTETYEVATLIVDLYDTKTKQLLWRGTSSDTPSNNANKNLDKGVEKILRNSRRDLE